MMTLNAVGWSVLVISTFHIWLLFRALLAWKSRRALAAHYAQSAQRSKAFRGFVARRRNERIRQFPDLNPDHFRGEESACRSVRTIADRPN
jgi:hypothetical protein